MIDKLKFLKGKVKEYIKFNIIGTSNFIVSQIFYITLFMVFKFNYIVAYTITSILSICAAYFLNSKFTFKNENYSAKKFSLSVLVYIFEYILNTLNKLYIYDIPIIKVKDIIINVDKLFCIFTVSFLNLFILYIYIQPFPYLYFTQSIFIKII